MSNSEAAQKQRNVIGGTAQRKIDRQECLSYFFQLTKAQFQS
jgi:hypothetical protein